MLKSEEQSFKEELRHNLSSAIIHYNRFAKSYTEKEKEKNIPDSERIKWELMQEKGMKYHHFSDQYSESLNALIEELMQELE